MWIYVLKHAARLCLGQRRGTELNVDAASPVDLLPCAQDIGILLQRRQNCLLHGKTRHRAASLVNSRLTGEGGCDKGCQHAEYEAADIIRSHGLRLKRAD